MVSSFISVEPMVRWLKIAERSACDFFAPSLSLSVCLSVSLFLSLSLSLSPFPFLTRHPFSFLTSPVSSHISFIYIYYLDIKTDDHDCVGKRQSSTSEHVDRIVNAVARRWQIEWNRMWNINSKEQPWNLCQGRLSNTPWQTFLVFFRFCFLVKKKKKGGWGSRREAQGPMK